MSETPNRTGGTWCHVPALLMHPWMLGGSALYALPSGDFTAAAMNHQDIESGVLSAVALAQAEE